MHYLTFEWISKGLSAITSFCFGLLWITWLNNAMSGWKGIYWQWKRISIIALQQQTLVDFKVKSSSETHIETNIFWMSLTYRRICSLFCVYCSKTLTVLWKNTFSPFKKVYHSFPQRGHDGMTKLSKLKVLKKHYSIQQPGESAEKQSLLTSFSLERVTKPFLRLWDASKPRWEQLSRNEKNLEQ